MQPRLTLVRINREFRLLGLRARLEKENNWGRIIYVLKAAAVEGGEFHRYVTTRRVNRYSLEMWVELAGKAVEKAQKREGFHEWKIEKAIVADPLGGAEWVKLEVVRIEDGRREWISVANGPDARERLEQKRAELYGDAWRLSKGAIQPVLDGVPVNPPALRLEKVEEPKEPELTLEDAVALAHLVADDLAEGKLSGDKVRVVQELVGGRVRQTNGAYKYALIVGRWVIKADKGRKPGDDYFLGSAGETMLIDQIKAQHADLEKNFPLGRVVNYFTSVQERTDPDPGRYTSARREIDRIAKLVNIGDSHQGNVGFRSGDTTPVFFDVQIPHDRYGANYKHINKLFYAEYELDSAKRELAKYQQRLSEYQQAVESKSREVQQLKQGA